jgi:hypothetical protein
MNNKLALLGVIASLAMSASALAGEADLNRCLG